MRFGIELMKVATAPLDESTGEATPSGLQQVIAERSEIRFDWVERTGTFSSDKVASPRFDSWLRAGCMLAIFAAAVFAIVGAIATAAWLISLTR